MHCWGFAGRGTLRSSSPPTGAATTRQSSLAALASSFSTCRRPARRPLSMRQSAWWRVFLRFYLDADVALTANDVVRLSEALSGADSGSLAGRRSAALSGHDRKSAARPPVPPGIRPPSSFPRVIVRARRHRSVRRGTFSVRRLPFGARRRLLPGLTLLGRGEGRTRGDQHRPCAVKLARPTPSPRAGPAGEHRDSRRRRPPGQGRTPCGGPGMVAQSRATAAGPPFAGLRLPRRDSVRDRGPRCGGGSWDDRRVRPQTPRCEAPHVFAERCRLGRGSDCASMGSGSSSGPRGGGGELLGDARPVPAHPRRGRHVAPRRPQFRRRQRVRREDRAPRPPQRGLMR